MEYFYKRKITLIIFILSLKCGQSLTLYPLKGEDKECYKILKVSGDNVEATAAIKTMKSFINAIKNKNYSDALYFLGKNTKKFLHEESLKRKINEIEFLRKGQFYSISSVEEDPIKFLLQDEIRIFDDSGENSFNKKETSVTIITSLGKKMSFPAYLSQNGWKIELIKNLNISERDKKEE